MSSGIWTKAMIENQKDLGTDLSILFPKSSIDNYIYLERYSLSYSHTKYIYSIYTSDEVIKNSIINNNDSKKDYILIHKDQFDKVFNILSEAPND